MTATLTRQKLHTFVDELPDDSLPDVEATMLRFLDDPDYATDEELAAIAEGDREFEEHPENFTSWADVKKELGLDRTLTPQGGEYVAAARA
jgi:hypothetical protein